MPLWLFKNEPECYAYSDLEREDGTVWDGITNALAQKHLRGTKKGDRVFYYHTGNEKAIVGVMQVAADPVPDPEDEAGKRVVVAVKPLARLAKPVTLAAIKAEPLLAGWELVRISRLSVMPVSVAQWERIEEMSRMCPGNK